MPIRINIVSPGIIDTPMVPLEGEERDDFYKKVTKDNLDFFDDIKKINSNSNRPVIIFPQGTRALPNDRTPFKKGATRIYDELKIDCQPIAINSGFVWPKKGAKQNNRTITISILEPIKAGLNKEEFIKILQNKIYSELDFIN